MIFLSNHVENEKEGEVKVFVTVKGSRRGTESLIELADFRYGGSF